MFFKPIRKVIDNMTKIEQGLVLKELVEKQGIDKLIIKLNTESQLFDLNVDSEGVQLSSTGGNYSPVTLLLSGTRKDSLSAINLKDTGDMYGSARVRVENGTVFITMDTVKDGVDLIDRWGDFVGLTDESLQIVIDAIEEILPEIIKELLLS